MVLPFLLAVAGKIFFDLDIQPSISDYYHTEMRDILVGSLWMIGAFLLVYKGPALVDNLLAKLACLSAIGISIFPTPVGEKIISETDWVGWMHYLCAAVFFGTLIIFTLFLFTRTNQGIPPTQRKLVRNQLYTVCGLVMLTCVLLIGLYKLIPPESRSPVDQYQPVFWLETIAILAFGISWFVKGEAILRDRVND
jgi:heme A synthase